MTKGELARYIKDLECKYSEFMATKFANGLSLGHCNLECLEQKAFLAKETIKVLQRFYNEGKLCPAEDCTIVGKTFKIYKICGVDPLGTTVELPETYICYYTYVNDSTSMSIIFSAADSAASFLGITYELYGTLSNSSADDCDWQEYCITEDEALDMYKKTKQILGVKCNCN